MNYYATYNDNEIKTIEHYPQTKMRRGYNPVKGHRRVKVNQFPNAVPKLELQIDSKAKSTNYLHRCMIGFGWIVDNKLKNILLQFKLPPNYFYPVKAYWDDMVLEYFWFHYIVDDFWKYVNNKDSYGEVLAIGEGFKVKRKIMVESEKQTIEDTSGYVKNEMYKIGEIHMTKDFPRYDFYQTRCIEYKTLISEPLKNRLIEEGITGLEIKPYPKFVVS